MKMSAEIKAAQEAATASRRRGSPSRSPNRDHRRRDRRDNTDLGERHTASASRQVDSATLSGSSGTSAVDHQTQGGKNGSGTPMLRNAAASSVPQMAGNMHLAETPAALPSQTPVLPRPPSAPSSSNAAAAVATPYSHSHQHHPVASSVIHTVGATEGRYPLESSFQDRQEHRRQRPTQGTQLDLAHTMSDGQQQQHQHQHQQQKQPHLRQHILEPYDALSPMSTVPRVEEIVSANEGRLTSVERRGRNSALPGGVVAPHHQQNPHKPQQMQAQQEGQQQQLQQAQQGQQGQEAYHHGRHQASQPLLPPPPPPPFQPTPAGGRRSRSHRQHVFSELDQVDFEPSTTSTSSQVHPSGQLPPPVFSTEFRSGEGLDQAFGFGPGPDPAVTSMAHAKAPHGPHGGGSRRGAGGSSGGDGQNGEGNHGNERVDTTAQYHDQFYGQSLPQQDSSSSLFDDSSIFPASSSSEQLAGGDSGPPPLQPGQPGRRMSARFLSNQAKDNSSQNAKRSAAHEDAVDESNMFDGERLEDWSVSRCNSVLLSLRRNPLFSYPDNLVD